MPVSYDVAGLNIVIVGGTTGLGFSAARALAANGARLVICGRAQSSVTAALDTLGPNARGFAGDAVDPGTADSAVALAVSAFGRLDALYHVAGGSGRSQGDGPLHEVSDAGWEHTLNLNLSSVFRSNRAALRQFLGQGGGGTILNMSSVLGWSPSPGYFASHAYAAAKAAVIGLSMAAASRYAAQNIRVNVIAPALVETPMSRRAAGDAEIMDFIKTKQPLDGGRIGLPADLDGAALFLLSRQSHFITGQVLAVDGGWCVSEGGELPRKSGMTE
jgi:NAD(P)-dependent dehydrogenase (short-subunit alcohol dehydrogenase family)